MTAPGVDTNKLRAERLPVEKVIQKAGSLALFLALGYVLEFTVLAILRMGYPYELEWIEGAYVDEARRVLLGIFPYGPPSIFFVPTSKTPLFFYLSASLMKLLGAGFLAPRLLSTLSTLGCFLLLVAIANRQLNRGEARPPGEFPRFLPGLVAAGFYAASFRFTGAWMDLAKTDSLFLFLILGAFYTGQRARGVWGSLASGALFALAYFTKQLALPVVLVLAPVSLLATQGRSWLRWASAGAIGLSVFAILDGSSSGWFSFYTFDTVATHAWQPDLWLFWKRFLPELGPALLLAAYYAFFVLRKTVRKRWEAPPVEWESLGLGVALILSSWSIFIKSWTYDNGFMLASLGVALLAGLGTARLLQGSLPPVEESTGPGSSHGSLQGIALGMIFLQFGLLFYNPVEQLPSAADRADAQAFIHQVASLPGEVLVFNHGHVNYLAGKTSYLHSAPYGDVVGSTAPPGSDTALRKEAVLEVFSQSLAEQRFDWIVLDQAETNWLPYYIFVKELSPAHGDFYPVTGARTRPQSLMTKNPVARGGALPLGQALYDNLFTTGWSQPENGMRWAIGGRSMVRVALEREGYEMVVQVRPACTGGSPAITGINVGWNTSSLGQVTFLSCAERRVALQISRDQVGDGFDELWFKVDGEPVRMSNGSEGSQPIGWAAFHSIEFTQR